jgi:hypothetical protein
MRCGASGGVGNHTPLTYISITVCVGMRLSLEFYVLRGTFARTFTIAEEYSRRIEVSVRRMIFLEELSGSQLPRECHHRATRVRGTSSGVAEVL